MPSTIQPSEIKLSYQVYSENYAKPTDAILLMNSPDQKFAQDVMDDLVERGMWNETLENQFQNNQLYFKVFRSDEEMTPEDAIQFSNIRLLPNRGLLNLEEPLQNTISSSMNWLSSFIPESIKQGASNLCDSIAQWTEDKLTGFSVYSAIPKVEELAEDVWHEIVEERYCERSDVAIQSFHNAEKEAITTQSTSLLEFLLNTAWRCAAYTVQNPLQTFTLFLAMQTALQQMPVMSNSHKSSPAKYSEENSFGQFTKLLTKASLACSTTLMLQGGRHATPSIAFVNLASLFSSAAAQPWRASYPTPYNLDNLDGQAGTKIFGDLGDSVGTTVCSVGDVNGDGKTDFLIGSPSNTDGSAYLVYGGDWLNTSRFLLANLNGVNGVKFLGVLASDNTGSAVSFAGDVNGDGKPDFLIGASGANNGAGAVYLIYGGSWLNMRTFSLANLNGVNGVKFLGFSTGDSTGNSVSFAGDVNGDGTPDFLIGAFGSKNGAMSGVGAVYLVYGGSWLNMRTFSLANLDGAKGVKFLGVYADDSTGYSLSFADDVNGDGKSDFLIGAYGANNGAGAGAVYLVYGGSWLSMSTFSFADLNNVEHGVKFLGLSNGDGAGNSVSSAGDVNQDGKADFLIGAKSGAYLIYSGSWLSMLSTSTFSLGFLNGNNGIKFLSSSVSNNVLYPCFVSFTRNFSGNNRPNLLISSIEPGGTGAVYLIYPDSWLNTPTFNFYNLDGTKGIKFLAGYTGASPSLSAAGYGDINGDGAIDFLIGSPSINTVYLVNGFGFTLWTNTLSLSRADKITINTNMLNTTGVMIPTNLIITTNDRQHGYFELISNPGQAITHFTQQQINEAQIQFIHDGSSFAPAYTVALSASTTAASISAVPAQITFNQNPPALVSNNLILDRAQTIPFTLAQLNSTGTPAYWPISTSFAISNLQHGHFENRAQPGQTISFTQVQLNLGQIQFVHEGSAYAPSYSVTVSDPGMSSFPLLAQITFSQNPPALLNNLLVLNRAQKILLTPTQFNSRGTPVYWPKNTTFTISNRQHGYFENIARAGNSIIVFTQYEVNQGQIQFVHDGSSFAPAYAVSVSDPGMLAFPEAAQILFTLNPPAFINNTLSVTQAQSIVLNRFQLSGLSLAYPNPANQTMSISGLQYGRFELITQPGQYITTFTQEQIDNAQVLFIHDGSCNAPVYAVGLSDPGMTIPPDHARINFVPFAPNLTNNRLMIHRNQTLTLNLDQLSAEGFDYTNSQNLQFLINNPTHITFSSISFLQKDLALGNIKVTHDGSLVAPRYEVSLINCRYIYGPWQASIKFDLTILVTPSPSSGLDAEAIDKLLLSGLISGGVSLAFFVLKFYLDYLGKKRLKTALEKSDMLDPERAAFHKNVVIPAAERIFAVVKVTGIFSSSSEEKMSEYKDAVIHLVDKLRDSSVNVDLDTMDLLKQSALFSIIAKQTKKHVVPDVPLCSKQNFARFFVAHASPQDIWDKTEVIVVAVKEELNRPKTHTQESLEEIESGNQMNVPLLSF